MTDDEIVTEIARLSGVTVQAKSKTTDELLFLLAIVDNAFERGYRTAQDGARR